MKPEETIDELVLRLESLALQAQNISLSDTDQKVKLYSLQPLSIQQSLSTALLDKNILYKSFVSILKEESRVKTSMRSLIASNNKGNSHTLNNINDVTALFNSDNTILDNNDGVRDYHTAFLEDPVLQREFPDYINHIASTDSDDFKTSRYCAYCNDHKHYTLSCVKLMVDYIDGVDRALKFHKDRNIHEQRKKLLSLRRNK